MPEIKNDPNRDYLDLLKMNYDNLHKASWEAHRISWIMTGIFVPIIFTTLGYFLKELDSYGRLEVTAGAVLLIFIVWFWFIMNRILAHYNSVRFDQLKALETTFNQYYSSLPIAQKVSLRHYALPFKVYDESANRIVKFFRRRISDPVNKWFFGLRFRDVTLLLSIFLTILLIVIVVMKFIADC